ncbi:MAG: CotH kinase family protein, partial [Patescibacteria group bacterium]
NIFETYYSNQDWIESNIKIWRYNGVDRFENLYYGNDGKFRWMVYDLDGGFGIENVGENILEQATVRRDYSGREWPYVILRRILSMEEFKIRFANRYADLLNSVFLPEKIIPRIDRFESTISSEMPRHIARWRDTLDGWKNPYLQSVDEWMKNVQDLREFAINRPQYAFGHVQEQFGLEGTYKITFSGLDTNKGSIKISTLTINSPEWSGTYFKGIPVTVEALPYSDHKFLRWEGSNESTDKVLSIDAREDIVLKPIFE